MNLTNQSNYPVTVKGERIETGETVELDVDDIEYYRKDRRFQVEEDDEPEPDEGDASEDNSESKSDDKEEEGDS
jgi:hypothetical protein